MCSIWGTASKSQLNILERRMRTTARSIYGLSRWEPVKDLIAMDLGWMLPYTRYLYKLLCFMFTINNHVDHIPFFENKINKQCNTHNHNTRNNLSLRITIKPKCKLSERSIEFVACKKWNELPVCVSTSCISSFRKTLKQYLLTIM
jgi:hypothetical protein